MYGDRKETLIARKLKYIKKSFVEVGGYSSVLPGKGSMNYLAES